MQGLGRMVWMILGLGSGCVLESFFNIRTLWRGFVCVLAPSCPDTFEIGQYPCGV